MAVIAAQILPTLRAFDGAVDILASGSLNGRQHSPVAGLMVSKVRPLVAMYNHH
jgi:hypothetical protein